MPNRVAAVLFAVLLVVGAARLVAVITMSVGWDELALLQRAAMTARTGILEGGGRPGLATLVLIPLALDCRNAVEAVVQARLFWTAVVAVAAVALWFLLHGLLRSAPHRRLALATGTGLWLLAPPFLQASTQVRTDQPAIMFGLLGGIALLKSRARLGWAAGSGILFGTGFLFSQKLLYVGGLAVALAFGQLVIRSQWHMHRELTRVALTVVGFVVVVLGYRELMKSLFTAPMLLPMSAGLSTFEFYREAMGWELYRRMLPMLVPQIFVLLSLVALTLAWLRDRGRHGSELIAAWSVAAVGIAVILFHAGRYEYFYMVLGLYVAAIGALILGPVLERLHSARFRAAYLAFIWVPLAGLGALQAGAMTAPEQRYQRASLDWVERNFSPAANGYNERGTFTCRADPFPVRFGQHLQSDFGSELRLQRTRELLMEFRRRPVAFMIPPQGKALLWFPSQIREFWRTRYVHYHGPVHVAGRHVHGSPGWSGFFEPVVGGEYIWRAVPQISGPLEIAGHEVEPGMIILLEEQILYPLRLPEGGEGMLVIALPEPPAPDTTPFF